MVMVSCGFSELYLSDLKEEGPKTILINGGDPQKTIPIELKYTFSKEHFEQLNSVSDIRAVKLLYSF